VHGSNEVNPLRIGVVGAGAIAQRNARESAASGAAQLVAVFDVNHKASREMSKALSIPAFGTYEELLRSADVEAVLISTPHHLHCPMTVDAAAHGKHVLVEKPIATSLADAQRMHEACRDAAVKLSVNYSFRYLGKIRKARQLIVEGALGEIVGIQIINHQYKDAGYWSGARSNSPDNWRGSREMCGGGYLIMNVCHAIDYVWYLTGLRADRVSCEYATLGSKVEVEDICSATFRMENGSVGSISASSIMRGVGQTEERIWGTNGSLVIRPEGISVYSTRPIDGRRPGKLYELTKLPDGKWTADWVRAFAHAVRAGTEPEISFRDAWDNLAFIMAAYDSMTQGRSMAVPRNPFDC
jgi:predicted dehydrogenase